jgi:hypothetical protein
MANWTPEYGRQLLDSGTGADFIIECRGQTWKVHKIVISAGSEHFGLLCHGNFKVRYTSGHIPGLTIMTVYLTGICRKLKKARQSSTMKTLTF